MPMLVFIHHSSKTKRWFRSKSLC